MKFSLKEQCVFVMLCALANITFGMSCGENLLGDYATEEKGIAVLRIEKINGKILIRKKTNTSEWDIDTGETRDMTQEGLYKLWKPEIASHSCGLLIEGGTIFKLPIGTMYEVSSITGKSSIQKNTKTSYLFYSTQGFSVQGVELYKILAIGKSPVSPSGPIKGQEIFTSASCPGGKLPDMTQKDFNGLSTKHKDFFHERKVENQSQFICGQFLNELMQGDGYLNTESIEERYEALKKISALLDAHQIPRDENGNANWLRAAQNFSNFLRPAENNNNEVLFRKNVKTVFIDKVLPMLGSLTLDTSDYYVKFNILGNLLTLKEDDILFVIKNLNNIGIFRYSSKENSESIALKLLREKFDGMPQSVFDYFLREAGSSAVNDKSMMYSAIDGGKIQTVNRLLAAGANPAHDALLARARAAQNEPSEIYQLLLSKAIEYRSAKLGNAKIFAKELTKILPVILLQCKMKQENIKKEVDFLIGHGADITNAFKYSDENNIGLFALNCPDDFKEVIKLGVRMDDIYNYPPITDMSGYADQPLVMYLKLRTWHGTQLHRPDVVAAMLSQYNNAAQSLCKKCNVYLLELGINFSIENKNLSILKVILEYGANPNNMNAHGSPIFLDAVIKNKPKILDIMMNSKNKININLIDKNGISPLAWAMCYKANDSISWLNKNGAKNIGQPACKNTLRKNIKAIN